MAATGTATLIIGTPAQSVVVTPITGLMGPQAAGTKVATVSVLPAGGNYAVVSNNPVFEMHGLDMVVATGQTANPGSYTLSATATP